MKKYHSMILFLIIIFVCGCSSTNSLYKEKETLKIKIDTIKVQVPVVKESLLLVEVDDSLFLFSKKIVGKNQVDTGYIKGKIDIKRKIIDLDIKMPDQEIIKADTTKEIYKESLIHTNESTLDRLFGYIIAIMFLAIVSLLIYKFKSRS